MTTPQSKRQMAYTKRKRKAGYCSKCTAKSKDFYCQPCRLRHNENVLRQARAKREFAKMVKPVELGDVNL